MPHDAALQVIAGRYRLGAVIGTGGMGRVREGRDLRLDREVAVKFLHADLARDPRTTRRFEVEARAAAGLAHPNVVTIFDTGEDEGVPYIVMERLPGRTLGDEIAAGPVGEDRACQLAVQILGALETAHECGVLHRDIKPGNILLTTTGDAKVADFGIAQVAEGHDATTAGVLLGTPAYLAPERLSGAPATAASDLYAVGVLLYEAITGCKPFEGDTPIAMAHAIHTGDPVPVLEVRPATAPALAAAIERAMAREPEQRFRSAADMGRALRGEHVPAVGAAISGEVASEAGQTVAAPIPDTASFALAPESAPVEAGSGTRLNIHDRVERLRSRTRRDPSIVVGAAAVVLLLVVGLLLRAAGDDAPTQADPTATSVPAPSSTLDAGLADAIDDLDEAVQP